MLELSGDRKVHAQSQSRGFWKGPVGPTVGGGCRRAVFQRSTCPKSPFPGALQPTHTSQAFPDSRASDSPLGCPPMPANLQGHALLCSPLQDRKALGGQESIYSIFGTLLQVRLNGRQQMERGRKKGAKKELVFFHLPWL